MNSSEFDLVVIGAGPGGYVAAIRAAQLGLKVACVERESALGGTCLRIGCIPSKALLESSELFREAKLALASHGIRIPNVELDLAAMMGRKEQIVSTLTKGVESLFKKNNVTRYVGNGRIEGIGRVSVQNQDETIELKSKHILIATGSLIGFYRILERHLEFGNVRTNCRRHAAVSGTLFCLLILTEA